MESKQRRDKTFLDSVFSSSSLLILFPITKMSLLELSATTIAVCKTRAGRKIKAFGENM